MIFDYDPRTRRESIGTESSSYRLLKDILVEQIVSSMSTGTASNYITNSYGSNHRILYEGVAQLLAEIVLSATDNIEDVEYTQLRAEYVSTRLLYSIFPDEENIPEGDNVGEIIQILLQTYSALLEGATKQNIDQALENIASNALVSTEVENYILNTTTSILAVTEYNEDGVVSKHKHYAFAHPNKYGATNKPLGYRWGDEIHSHEIINGVVQPYTDSEGISHTHEVYFGLPENILKLQSNLRKTLNVLKPAHLKTGSISSVIQELDSISPNLDDFINGTDSISLGLGSLYQEDMRKSRVGTVEDEIQGYAVGNQIRLWRHGASVADTIYATWSEIDPNTLQVVSKTQKLRVISISEESPEDQTEYQSGDTLDFVRDVNSPSAYAENVRIENGCLLPPEMNEVGSFNLIFANDGEILRYSRDGKVYHLTVRGFEGEATLPATKPYGYRSQIKSSVITVDSKLQKQGFITLRLASLPWKAKKSLIYTTDFFVNQGNDPFSLNLPFLFQKKVLKSYQGLPIIASDLSLEINGVQVQDPFFFDPSKNLISSQIALFNQGDDVSITYPKAESEIRLLRELNNLEMTLNAVRPARKVSLSGRGEDSNRVISTTEPLSYVLNEVSPTRPLTYSEKISTYSVSTSDITNTINQNLNSSFVLNKGSFNLNLSQDQVFAPASKTIEVTQDEVFFSQLGFIPSYISSIEDSLGNSYLWEKKETSVIVKDLTTPATLTITSISSTPIDLNQEWFKGEKLAEGQAFLARTDTSKLPNITESSPEELIQNPLGLAPDQDRNIYANRQIQEEGVRGELELYTDEVFSYEINGSGGYFLDHDHMQYEDEVLYQDPTLYVLNPRSEIDTNTVNTIPTYLFFNYFFLNVFGGDGHYFSIYRVGLDGVKYYQTLTPIADGNGFFAIEEYPNLPAPNGSPLAYRFVDDGSGGGFNVNYSNGEFADNYTAEINASFNHIPHQTYFIELYMEEDGGGADSLFFFSSGTNAPFVLGTSWDTSAETYRLDDALGGGIGVSYYFEVLFATNPGEVVSFQITQDEYPTYPKDPENVGVTHEIQVVTYYSENLYPVLPLGFDPNVNFMPENSDGSTPYYYAFEDQLSFESSLDVSDIVLVSEVESNVSVSDSATLSYLILPSNNNEVMAEMADDVALALRYQTPPVVESLPVVTDEVEYFYDLGDVLVADSILISDEVVISLRMTPISETDILDSTDDVIARISSFNVSDEINLLDEVEASYSLTPLILDDVITLSDDTSTSFQYQTQTPSDNTPSATDDVSTRFTTFTVRDTATITDDVTTSYSLNKIEIESTIAPLGDSLSYLPNYDPVSVSDFVSVTDQVTSFISGKTVSDSILISDTVATSYSLSNLIVSDSTSATDTVTTSYSFTPESSSSSVNIPTDEVNTSYALNPESTQTVSDDVTTSYSFTPISQSDTISFTDDITTVSRLFVEDTTNFLTSSLNTQIRINSEVSGEIAITDEVTTNLSISAISVASSLALTDDVSTSYSFTNIAVSDSVSLSDDVSADLGEAVLAAGTISLSDDVTYSTPSAFVVSNMNMTDEVDTRIADIVRPSLIVGVRYNNYANVDNELFSIYKGSMDTLEYIPVYDLQPDADDITAVQITQDSKEIKITALLEQSYSNFDGHANLRFGELEYDTSYKIYAYTEYLDNTGDISVALKAGTSAVDPVGYVYGLGFTDLMPGSTVSDYEKYYVHSFYIRSSDNAVIFTADSPNSFTFTSSEQVRLYMYSRYTYTDSTDDSDRFRIRVARPDATFSTPNGSTSDATGWFAPSIHDANLTNSSPSGTYEETQLPNSSYSNTDNESQVSWQLNIGTRYHLQLDMGDHSSDFEVFLEPRTEDNGASWNTEYSSSDTLSYVELMTTNDNQSNQFNHFFTIRRDGFIIWEQDPGS